MSTFRHASKLQAQLDARVPLHSLAVPPPCDADDALEALLRKQGRDAYDNMAALRLIGYAPLNFVGDLYDSRGEGIDGYSTLRQIKAAR